MLTPEVKRIAQVAYEAYVKKTGGVSLATGDKLPEWFDLKEPMREAWAAAAIGVATEMKNRAMDAFYGYAEIY